MPHILIVDDEANERAFLRIILTQAGHTVAEADLGAAGVREFAARPADLVICDLLLPDRDEVDVVAEMRNTAPGIKVIAVIGGTFIASSTELSEAIGSINADRIMMRPFAAEALLDAVAALLSPDAADGA